MRSEPSSHSKIERMPKAGLTKKGRGEEPVIDRKAGAEPAYQKKDPRSKKKQSKERAVKGDGRN